MFTPLDTTVAASTKTKHPPDGEWLPAMPIPDNASAPPAGHPTRGKPTAIWSYRDANGKLLGQIWRFDDDAGVKTILPLTFCQNSDTGKSAWRWKGFGENRPLYGLDRLALFPTATVIVTEGEKAADAIGRLLPDHVAVTSPNGSKSAGKANWNPLHRRKVIIWPDADQPGADYATHVARLLTVVQAAEVAIITPPPDVSAGWDAADAVVQGWTTARTMQLVQSAQPWTGPASSAEVPTSEGGETSGGGRRTSQRDEVLALLDDFELWHSPDRVAYASIKVSGHTENWAVRSRDFKIWLSGEVFARTGRAAGSQMLEDALRVMEAQAIHKGRQHTPFLRVGWVSQQDIFIDLGRPEWSAVKITSSGWSVVYAPDVKFVRAPAMAAMPVPESAETIEDLRAIANLRSDGEFQLLVSWLIAAMRPEGPYPILAVNGEQGSSKSTLSRLARMLVDPNAAPIRSCPKDERDLVSMARNSWVIVLDNISDLPGWLSDGLCRIATGGGFSSRELYSDAGESIFQGQRPIILNGIPDFAGRADLADRCIMLNLPSIPEDKRRAESDFWADFDERSPRIFGALLDGVSGAMRRWDTTVLKTMPRMADFARWACAGEYSLGWNDGNFMDAYAANRKAAVENSIEADPVIEAVRLLANDRDFEGSATALLLALEGFVADSIKCSRYWPTAHSLKKRLQRGQAPLRTIGIILDLDRRATGSDRTRLIGVRIPNRYSQPTT